MLDDEVLEAGLHYAKLYEASTGIPYLGPQRAQHHPPVRDHKTSLRLEGITVDMERNNEELFTGVGTDKPMEITGRIIAPGSTVFKEADVCF